MNRLDLNPRVGAHPRVVGSNKEKDIAGTRIFFVYIKMFCLLVLVQSDRQRVR